MAIESAIVRNKIHLTQDVIECTFELNEHIVVHPGQYILIKIENIWKSFSVIETLKGDVIKVVIQLVDETLVAKYFKTLKIGDTVYVQEPQGTVSVPDENDIVFVATGTGIIPLHALAKRMLEKGFKHKITVIFGVRSELNLFYSSELKQLERYDNCTIIITASSPTDSWSGQTGRVSDYIKNHIDELKTAEFYMCGRKETVASLVGFLENLKIESSKIHFIE